MDHVSFTAEPSERAMLRWVIRARGSDVLHAGLFAYPVFPQGAEFICFDGCRVHRWTRPLSIPGLPLLGCAFVAPDLSGAQGVDVLTLQVSVGTPLVQFSGLIGKAQSCTSACLIPDAGAFRDAALPMIASIRAIKGQWVVFNLQDRSLSYLEQIAHFETTEVAGEGAFAIDPGYLKEALPFVPSIRKKQLLYLGANEKSMLLATGQQLAVIALKVAGPPDDAQPA